MKEIVSKRRINAKIFDLGGGRRKVVTSVAPLHYVRDGHLVDIDTTLRTAGDLLEVSEASYRLKIDPGKPAYLYTNGNGRQVEVELVAIDGEPAKAGRSVQEAGTVRWTEIARQTDAAFRPLRKGVEALVVLQGPKAPKSWTWRVRGDQGLLLAPKGHDAQGQALELEHAYDGDLLTITWTGRATSQQRLRGKGGFSEEIAWPALIDPTVNESIVDGADDGSSFIFGTFISQFLSFSTMYAGLYYSLVFYAGVRFQSLAVPQGAQVTSATLTIDIMSISGPVSHNVAGDDVDDAPQWSTSSRIKDITQTTAQVPISPSATGLYPIGVTSIVQEIIDRPGWVSGNNMRFALFPTGRGDHHLSFAALEHATRTEAQIEIEYEGAGFSGVYLGGTQINSIKHGSDSIVAVYLGTTQIFDAG